MDTENEMAKGWVGCGFVFVFGFVCSVILSVFLYVWVFEGTIKPGVFALISGTQMAYMLFSLLMHSTVIEYIVATVIGIIIGGLVCIFQPLFGISLLSASLFSFVSMWLYSRLQ
jgi:hypothetical protein